MNIYIVVNTQHYDCHKRSETCTEIIDVYKNKVDAVSTCVNFNLGQIINEDGEYLENELYISLEDEIDDDDLSYKYSHDNFFWKKYGKDIAKLNIDEDVLEDVNNILIEYLKNKEDAEYSMYGSYNIYDVETKTLM
jgi:hypothetical protein